MGCRGKGGSDHASKFSVLRGRRISGEVREGGQEAGSSGHVLKRRNRASIAGALLLGGPFFYAGVGRRREVLRGRDRGGLGYGFHAFLGSRNPSNKVAQALFNQRLVSCRVEVINGPEGACRVHGTEGRKTLEKFAP